MANKIKSFAQLVKQLLNSNLLSKEQFFNIINSLDLIEDSVDIYNNFDIQVYYTQLPVIVAGDVLVKIVLLKQANDVALVFPQNVIDTYEVLTEDPETLALKNTEFSLYAEVYGFNSDNAELQNLIKRAYLYAGNSLATYELTGALAKEKEKKDQDKSKDTEGSLGLGDGVSMPTTGASDPANFFSDIKAPTDAGSSNVFLDPNMQVNEEAYKKFKKQTTALENLLKKLHAETPRIIRENIRKKFYHNILVIEVDNKSIYEALSMLPGVAKKLISETGELIRKNNGTQLIDSFNLNNKRYFTVAEAAGNNFWIVEGEKLPKAESGSRVTKPIQDNIIRLSRSQVRHESRSYKPFIINNEIVYKK